MIAHRKRETGLAALKDAAHRATTDHAVDRCAAIAEASGIPHQRVPSEAELKALWNKRVKVLTANEPPRENHPRWRVRVFEYAPCDTPDEDKNDGAHNAGSNVPF